MTNQYAPPQSNVEDVNRSNTAGITSKMLEAMRGTKPWVLLIGVALMVFAVFTLIATIGMIGASAVGPASMGGEAGIFIGVAAMYAVMGIVYIMMGIYLFKYSSSIGRLLESAGIVDMEDALNAQRKFWKIAGIITVIMLVLMVLGMIAAVVIPIMTMTNL